jgi:3',5'-cyclic-AMP phosphodiesterase
VLAVIAGHVHRATFGLIAGRPAFTAPSTYDEAVLDLVSDQLAFGSRPPGFAVHAFDGGRLVTHVQSIGARLGDAEG